MPRLEFSLWNSDGGVRVHKFHARERNSVCSGCYNKTPKNARPKNNRNVLFPILWAGKCKIKSPANSVSDQVPFLIAGTSSVPSHAGRPTGSLRLFYKTANPILESCILMTQSPPTAPTSSSIQGEIQHTNFARTHTHLDSIIEILASFPSGIEW